MSTDRAPSTSSFADWDGDRSYWGNESGGVLLPIGDDAVPGGVVDLARSIAVGRETRLVVLDPVCLPEQTPLDLPSRHLEDRYAAVADVRETIAATSPDLVTRGAIHVGRDRGRLVAGAVAAYGSDAVVLDGSWRVRRLSPVAPTPVETLSATIECPIAVPTADRFPGAVSSVLVPVSGGPHSGAATEIALALATAHDASIELLHVVTSGDEDGDGKGTEGGDAAGGDGDGEADGRGSARGERGDARGRRVLDACAARLGGFDRYDTWLLEADSVADAVVEQSRYYDVTVIGAPRTPRLRRFVAGSTSRTIADRGANAVVTVRQ